MNPNQDTETSAATGRVITRAQRKAGAEKPESDDAVQDLLNATNPCMIDPAIMEYVTGDEKLTLEERIEHQHKQANNLSRELIKLRAETEDKLRDMESKFKKVEEQVTNLEGKIVTGIEESKQYLKNQIEGNQQHLKNQIEERQQHIIGEVGSMVENMFHRFLDLNAGTGRENQPAPNEAAGPSRRSVNFMEPVAMSTRRSSERIMVNDEYVDSEEETGNLSQDEMYHNRVAHPLHSNYDKQLMEKSMLLKTLPKTASGDVPLIV